MHNYKGNQLFSTTPCPFRKVTAQYKEQSSMTKNTFRTELVKHIVTLIGEKTDPLTTVL